MSTWTYSGGIPLSTNNPSADQPNMKVNTDSIASILSVDMVGFNVSGGGYHNKITYVDQGASPPSGVAGTDILYARTISSVIELLLQRPTGSAIQMTRGTPSSANPGYTFLPGGMIMQWSLLTIGGGGSVVFTFPFTSMSSIYTIQASYAGTGSPNKILTAQGSGGTSCTVYGNSGAAINVLVIGA